MPLAALLAGGLLLGGGGSPAALSEVVVQLLAALTATALVIGPWRWHRSPPLAAWVVVGLLLAVPILQLIPLPPGLWHALPGRGVLREGLAIAGRDNAWHPLSLHPALTLASALALVVPAIMLVGVSALDRRDRQFLLAVLVTAGLAAVVLGAAQWAGGPGAMRFYAASHRDFPPLQFANRNAAADFLLIALMATPVACAGLPRGRVLALMAAALLALGVLVTGSRAGIVLLVTVALPATALALWPAPREPRRLARGLTAGLAGGALAIAALMAVPAFQPVAARFMQGDGARTALWAAGWQGVRATWPAGSGVGTAPIMLMAQERLDTVDQTLPNRVHNDWLEWLLEAGLPGILAGAVIIAILGRAFCHAWRDPARRGELRWAGASLAVLALHSTVDYPLRALALALLAALAGGIVLANYAEIRRQGHEGNGRR